MTATSHMLTVQPKPASEPGALDGHEARCTCGFSHGTSLGEREARSLAAAHADWAARQTPGLTFVADGRGGWVGSTSHGAVAA